jgi:hypothetical protein
MYANNNVFFGLMSSDLVVYDGDYISSKKALSKQEVVEYEIIGSRHNIRPLASLLKLHSLVRANNAIDLTVVDLINQKQRFNITYQLQSLLTNTR